MKDLGYHEGYKYAHDYEGNFVSQQYLPDGLVNSRFWTAGNNAQEARMQQRLDQLNGIGRQTN